MNGSITNTLSAYIPEFNNNNELFTGYPPVQQQQSPQPQVQLPMMNNNINVPLYPGNNTPVLINNMNMPIIDENGAMKRFNVNATRSSSSSSSTSSSAMSSLSMYQNKFNNELNESDSELLELKHRNDLSKLFEDDIFYCPRSLLSKQDIIKAERLLVEERLNHNSPYSNNHPIIESPTLNTVNMHPTKFNPYTSKSFNPTSF